LLAESTSRIRLVAYTGGRPPDPRGIRLSRVRDVLLTIWVVALLVLMIGGGGAGAWGLGRAVGTTGLFHVEPALAVPVGVAGVAVGGLGGLGIALLVRAFPDLLRRGTAVRLVLACVLATAVGAVLYLAVAGGLVWLAGLVLPDTVTKVLAVVLSLLGLPVVGPVTFWLASRAGARPRTR
jgi:hypothetical protein